MAKARLLLRVILTNPSLSHDQTSEVGETRRRCAFAFSTTAANGVRSRSVSQSEGEDWLLPFPLVADVNVVAMGWEKKVALVSRISRRSLQKRGSFFPEESARVETIAHLNAWPRSKRA